MPVSNLKPQTSNLIVGGMHCASCVSRIESALRKLDGVSEASVNLANGGTLVKFDPQKITLNKIKEAIASIGYQPLDMPRSAQMESGPSDAFLRLKRKLFAAIILTL